jgi:hypothetical protein
MRNFFALTKENCGKPEVSLTPVIQEISAKLSETANLAVPVSPPEYATSEPFQGELRIPHIILDDLIPTLSPAESLIYLRLYRLSYGFNRETCTASIWKLGRAVNLSQRATHRAIHLLEQRGLIKRAGHIFGRKGGGLLFQVNLPPVSASQSATRGNLSEKLEGDSFFENPFIDGGLEIPDPQLETIKAAYERETNNPWRPSDAAAYEKVKHVPEDKIIQAIHSAKSRAASRPNRFAYFVKEILHQANPSSPSRVACKHALKKIVDRIRSLHVGAHHYTAIDFIEDVKTACAREGVKFDNDLFNELVR